MKCPECNRWMTARNQEPSAWRCDYCQANWETVCDNCMERSCWDAKWMCDKADSAGIKTIRERTAAASSPAEDK